MLLRLLLLPIQFDVFPHYTSRVNVAHSVASFFCDNYLRLPKLSAFATSHVSGESK